MSYRTPLETRLAKKATQAIIEFGLIEDGDRIMVGLSGGKDSWALMQILDVLQQRAPIDFSIVGVNVNSGYANFQHDQVTDACAGSRLGVPRGTHEHRRGDGRRARRRRDAVLAVRAVAARCLVPGRRRDRRDEDRARPSSRRLRRNRASQPVLSGFAQGDARAPGLGQQEAHRDPPAGLRHRGRGPRATRASVGCRSSGAAVRPAAT